MSERWTLQNARQLSHEAVARTLRPGDAAIDATMGNGKDTMFLCGLVGEAGRVYAFDVQEEAISRTRERLHEAGVEGRAQLFHAGHETMKAHVPEGVMAAMFNLGWLPGAPHGVTTRTETTLAAVEQAYSLLLPGGVLTVCIYPGHEEGARELEALLGWAGGLSPREANALDARFCCAPPNTPRLLLIQKNAKTSAI